MYKNLYKYLIEKQQQAFNSFPIYYVSNHEQFKKQMSSIGLNENDFDKIIQIDDVGFITKDDLKKFYELREKTIKEIKDTISKDKNEARFIKDMFLYMFESGEYTSTGNLIEILEPFDMKKDRTLIKGLNQAVIEHLNGKYQTKDYER